MFFQIFITRGKNFSLLIGSQHIVSFDKTFIDIQTKDLDESCSYLLAHDFVDDDFTFILTSVDSKHQDTLKSKKLLVIQSGEDEVELELGEILVSFENC